MASLGLMRYPALTICLLVLAVASHQAHASSRGAFVSKNVAVARSQEGLCASWIIVHGYKCQEHEVITKDGYILSVQRIPEGRTNVSGSGAKKQPVIVQHGVVVDGTTWVLNSPEQNLPMILAENGFDVWIVNSRGTKYSRRHTHLKTENPAYWNWCWDDMVTYDLPAVFDYVFNKTGQKSNYVGHSLGTLVALASLSEGKLLNRMKSAALLSPVAFLSHMKTELLNAVARSLLGETLALSGFPEFDLKGVPAAFTFIKAICDKNKQDCDDMLTAITGKNCCLNSTTLDRFLANEPQPTSTKNAMHLSQTVRLGFVSKFNYERPDLNLMHYGQLWPPVYNFSNIPHDFPIFMSYGGEDALSDVTDVKNLLDLLKSHDADKLTVQFIKDYGHADFIIGFNAKDLVFNPVTEFFKRQL